MVDSHDFAERTGWELVEPLARCNYTATFRARPAGTTGHADYVVKLPLAAHDAIGVRLVQQEAFVGAVTSSPHLTTVLHAHVQAPPFFLVLPFHEGRDVQQRLQQVGHLALAKGLWIARQLTEGVRSLHEAGWIHRDIKPSNIVVSPLCHTTLIDFGLARPVDSRSQEELACTPEYAAPENFSSTHPPQPATDIYSIGMVLYEMLSGRSPFVGQTAYEYVAAHIQQPPPDPRKFVPDLPPRVVRLLRATLAKQPLRRPTVEELLQWLVELEIEHFDERHPVQRLAA